MVDLVGVLPSDFFAGDDLDTVGNNFADSGLDYFDVGIVFEADRNGINVAVGAEVGQRRIQIECDQRGSAEAVSAAQADCGGDRSFVSTSVSQVDDFITDAQVLTISCGLVDRQLGFTLWWAAFLDGHALNPEIGLP